MDRLRLKSLRLKSLQLKSFRLRSPRLKSLRLKTGPNPRPAWPVPALALVTALSALTSCTVGKHEAPVVGVWRAEQAGSIEFLEGGKLGEVTLVAAACRGDESTASVKFSGTWRHGEPSDAGYGALVRLTSADGSLTCEKYFQYLDVNGVETLSLNDLGISGTRFLRAGAGRPTSLAAPKREVRTDADPLQRWFPELGTLSAARWIAASPGEPKDWLHSELFDRSISRGRHTGSSSFDRQTGRVYFCAVNPEERAG